MRRSVREENESHPETFEGAFLHYEELKRGFLQQKNDPPPFEKFSRLGKFTPLETQGIQVSFASSMANFRESPGYRCLLR
ncbi:hypothetical protein THTE_0933 [Thermogutta terrifontis]|uniref:Uncharacterized protein n=1 Tax=Thermogutta terrifontis TaxID=1331910 RepID=A0A286RC58_9BACT|nr:hypothetical protein THTE_0933 [Thermogutta terrifontis]